MSTAIIPMAALYGWDKVAQGYVLSAFYCGYISTQILGGYLAETIGGCRVLAAAVTVWSLFTLLTPLAARRFPLVLLVRVLMGMGEGLALPAIHVLVSRNIPPMARSRAVGVITSGHGLGMIVALLASPILRWEVMFYAFGSLGYLWVAAYLAVAPRAFRETEDAALEAKAAGNGADDIEGAPDDDPRGPRPAATAGGLLLQSPVNSIPPVWTVAGAPLSSSLALYLAMLRNPHCLAIFAAHFATAWGWFIVLSWLPKYLKSLGADTQRAGMYAIAPFAAQVVSNVGAGWLADHLLEKGYNRTRVRKAMTAVALLGSGLALLLLAYLRCRSIAAVSAFMVVILGLKGFGHAGYGVNMIDIAPGATGQLFGLSNTIACSAGILGNVATGWLWQATGTFEAIFLLCAMIDAFGTLAFVTFATGNVVFKS
jgi:ACS family sodium-dependent inorganic phosphate cotransporter